MFGPPMILVPPRRAHKQQFVNYPTGLSPHTDEKGATAHLQKTNPGGQAHEPRPRKS